MALPLRTSISFSSTWRRAALVSLAVLVLAGIVVALAAGGGGGRDDADQSASFGLDESSGLDSASGALAAPPVASTADEEAATVGDDASGGVDRDLSATAVTPVAPNVIRTAALRVKVKGDVVEAMDRATGIAAGVGGFVASSSSSSLQAGRSSGEITVRVPVDRFDAVRRQLAGLGKVTSTESGSEEVGGQLVDLAARLRSLRAEEAALGAILGEAREIGQILQVRDRLTGIRTQIEQLAGQEQALRDRVAYATISVSLYEAGAPVVKPEPADEETTGLAASFRTSVDALLAVVGGMVIVLGAVLPFLVLLLVGLVAHRRFGRGVTAS